MTAAIRAICVMGLTEILFVGSPPVHSQTPSSQSLCSMPSSTPLWSKYCGGSSGAAAPGPAATTPAQQSELRGAQQLGYAIGEQLGKSLFGSSADDEAAQQAARQAQQQRQLAAQQLNNSGIYLLNKGNYAGAITEFQRALAESPGDATIQRNIDTAMKRSKDAVAAAKNAASLKNLLSNVPAHVEDTEFDQLTHASIPSPNSSGLSLVNLDSDTRTVDLRGTTKTSVDPGAFKNQLDRIFDQPASESSPPATQLQLPEAKDAELLFDLPPPTHLQLPEAKDVELLFDDLPSPTHLPYPFNPEMREDKMPRDSDICSLFPGLGECANYR
jgi:hypothetical protein